MTASVCGYALSIPGLAFKSPAETHTPCRFQYTGVVPETRSMRAFWFRKNGRGDGVEIGQKKALLSHRSWSAAACMHMLRRESEVMA